MMACKTFKAASSFEDINEGSDDPAFSSTIPKIPSLLRIYSFA